MQNQFAPDGTPRGNNDFVFTQDHLHRLLVRELKHLGVEPTQYIFSVHGEPTAGIAVRAVVDGRKYDPQEIGRAYQQLRDMAESAFEYPEMHDDTSHYVREQLVKMAAAGLDITDQNFLEVLLTDDEELAATYEANCPYYKEMRAGLWCWEAGEHTDEVVYGLR